MAKRTPEREQFLADILTTAVEGGIGYWSQVSDYGHEYCTPPVAIADTFAIVHEADPDEGIEMDEYGYAVRGLRVDIDLIAKGIGILTKGDNAGKAFSISGTEYWKQFLLANRTNGDDGDYDADIADNIVQAGLFGEIIYG